MTLIEKAFKRLLIELIRNEIWDSCAILKSPFEFAGFNFSNNLCFTALKGKWAASFILRSSVYGLRCSVFRLQAVKNLARFIRSEINVAARLEGNAKKKETNKWRKKHKKTSKCLAKSVPQKTVCVGGGDQEASGQAQLPSAQVSSQHSKCESNLFYLEHHLHRSCRLLHPVSLAGLRCCPYQPKSETFHAYLPSKSRVTAAEPQQTPSQNLAWIFFMPRTRSLACFLFAARIWSYFKTFLPLQFAILLWLSSSSSQSPNGNLSHSAPKLPEIEIKNLTKRLVFPLLHTPPPSTWSIHMAVAH